MVRGDVFLAQPLGQVARHAFGDAPLVDEDQRRAVLRDQAGQAVVQLLPHFGRQHGAQRRSRHLDAEIAFAHVAGVDDRHLAPALADEEAPHLVQRLHGGRQAHAHRRLRAQRFQPLQRQHQVRAPLAARHRMQFVDDHALDRLEHRAARLRTEQDVERFRRGDQDVRRLATHALAFRGGRVAGAHGGADAHVRQALPEQFRTDAGQRLLEVLADVVRQRLERRDVEDVDFVRESLAQPLAHQFVDGGQESRQRLAGARRRRDQCVLALRRDRPGLRLDIGRLAEAGLQPGGNGGVEREGGQVRIFRDSGRPRSRKDGVASCVHLH